METSLRPIGHRAASNQRCCALSRTFDNAMLPLRYFACPVRQSAGGQGPPGAHSRPWRASRALPGGTARELNRLPHFCRVSIDSRHSGGQGPPGGSCRRRATRGVRRPCGGPAALCPALRPVSSNNQKLSRMLDNASHFCRVSTDSRRRVLRRKVEAGFRMRSTRDNDQDVSRDARTRMRLDVRGICCVANPREESSERQEATAHRVKVAPPTQSHNITPGGKPHPALRLAFSTGTPHMCPSLCARGRAPASPPLSWPRRRTLNVREPKTRAPSPTTPGHRPEKFGFS